jgi:hypothetical protein
MATANDSNLTPRPLKFGSSEIYSLAQTAKAIDCFDQLTARLAQLRAMLHMVTGVGSDTFEQYSESIRESYLWACSMLADECVALSEHVQDREVSHGKGD